MDAADVDQALQQMQQLLHDSRVESAAQIAALRQAHGAMAAQNQQLLAQQQQLLQQAPLQYAPPPLRQPLMRIAAAKPYDGLAATSIDRWAREVAQQFAYYAVTTDVEQVRAASALLVGQALEWWAGLLAPGIPTTWAELLLQLRARFQLVTSVQVARAALDKLHQGTKSTADFISTFTGLVSRVPGMTEEEKIHIFLRAVRPATSTQLQLHDVATLDAAIKMASRMGGIGELHAAAASGGGGGAAMDLSNIEGLEADTGSSVSISRAEYTELLHAMREQRRAGGSSRGGSSSAASSSGSYRPRGLPVIATLTPVQVKEYMDAGKCFSCASTDHRSRECPTKKKSSN
jgi:hypothetical protein